MIQKTYHIVDFADGTFEQMIETVAQSEKYESAAQVLLMDFEQNWDTGEMKRKVSLLEMKLPKAEIAGITHSDWDEGNGNHSIFTFLFFERPSFRILHYDMKNKSEEELGLGLHADLDGIPNVRGVMLFLAEFGRDLEKMFSHAEKGYEQIPFFGAPAALQTLHEHDRPDERIGFVFSRDCCDWEHMLAVVFWGEGLSIRVKYNYGWTPIGKKMQITQKNGSFEVATINNQPATHIYKKYLGLDERQISIWNLCEFPLVMEKDGLIKARIPLYGDEEGNIRFSCSIEDASSFQFTYGIPDRIFHEVEKDSKEMRDFSPQAAFLIVCGNRKLFLQDEEWRETEYYREAVPELSSLHGNAELFRMHGKGGELNSALVSVAFREGPADGLRQMTGDRAERKTPLLESPETVPLQIRLMNFMRAMTEDLEEAVRGADSANRAKSEFLSKMSHEIRTPINAVLGMDEMILRETTEKQIKEYAMDIQSAGNSLLTLINDILDLSKIESGKLSIVPVEYRLSSMLNDLVNMIRFRAEAKELAFEVQVAEDLPAGLYGDDVRVKQVVTNILTNAVKYTREGTVWFRVSGRRDGGDGNPACRSGGYRDRNQKRRPAKAVL